MTTLVKLAEYLDHKHAISQIKPNKCTCEYKVCEELGSHLPGKCNCKNFTDKYKCYTGPLCDECAQYFPKQYLSSLDDALDIKE